MHPHHSDWEAAVADTAWYVAREAYARKQYLDGMKALHVKHQIVCRYWLANRCMSGNECVFLHEYKVDKLPLCAYIEAQCPDGDACMFRHEYLLHERRQTPRYDPFRAGKPGQQQLHQNKK